MKITDKMRLEWLFMLDENLCAYGTRLAVDRDMVRDPMSKAFRQERREKKA